MSVAAHIREQAERVHLTPSEAQKASGNYKKGHVRVHGLEITIENPRGSFRSGISPEGKPWKARLPAHYGYLKRTEGADGDHVDVFLGPHHKSPLVYVIDQLDHRTGKFDEHKCFLGFAHGKQVKAAYHGAFTDGEAKDRLGHLTEMTIAQFKHWLDQGDTMRPLHRASGGRVRMADGGNPEAAFDPITGTQITPTVADPTGAEPEQGQTSKALSRLTGTQFAEPRYQLWPERMVRSGVTAAGDAMSGDLPMWAADSSTGEIHTSPQAIERSQDMAGLAMGPSIADAPEAATLRSGLSRPAPTASETAGPFYSALEKTVGDIQQPKMTGDQWLGTLSNRPGVKPEEMQWTGLTDFLDGRKDDPVTKQDVIDHLVANKVDLREVNKGDSTKYQDYQLPGGENYREMLMTLPDRGGSKRTPQEVAEAMGLDWIDVGPYERQQFADHAEREGSKNSYRSSHWDEPNILAHMRMNDRDIGGKKSLHLEEIQSDAHQEARNKGYRSEDNPDGVPDLPFKKTWHELALKRMLHEAAANGYDRLSWTPGEAQAARYDLSKQIRSVRFEKTGLSGFSPLEHIESNQRGRLQAVDHNNNRVIDKLLENPEEDLPNHIGKEAAKKLLEQPPTRTVVGGTAVSRRELNGLDLKVGGEGMKGFYDQIVPKALEKIGKEHGIKVQNGDLNAKLANASEALKAFEAQFGSRPIPVDRKAEWNALRDAVAESKNGASPQPVHYIDIPQSLRDQVKHRGFPLFSDTGPGGATMQNRNDDRRQRARGGRMAMADGGVPAFDPDKPVGTPTASDIPSFDPAKPVGVPAGTPDAGALSAAGRGAYQGATFNFGDELRGLGEAGGVKPDEWNDPVSTAKGAYRYWTGQPGAEQTYDAATQRERALNKEASAQHPYAYGAGEVGGAVPTMLAMPGGAISEGVGLGTKMFQAARAGAQYGTVAGAGEGSGAGDRAINAVAGAGAGAAGGAASPLVGEGLGWAYNRFGKPVTDTLRTVFKGSDAEAGRRVFSALDADSAEIMAGKQNGMTPQQWEDARAAGEPVTLADLGGARTQSLLRSSANTSPEGRGALESTFNDRFSNQGERAADDVRNLVAGGANAGKTADQLVAEYDVSRKPAYAAAFNHPKAQGMWDADLEQMASAPAVQQAIKMASINAKDEATKLGLKPPVNPFSFNRDGTVTLTDPNFKPNLQFWDVVKKNLDKGDRSSQQWSGLLRNKLDSEVPQYGQARGVASQFFGERDALEAGRTLAGKRVDPEVVADQMRKMNPQERELFREGYASDWANRVIGNIGDNRDITKAMFNSPAQRKTVQAIFGPGGVQKVQDRITLETVMNGARNALGNSTTARQLIEAGLAGGAIGYGMDGWKGAAEGAFGAATARHMIGAEMAAGAKKLIGRIDKRTASRVAELLTSQDPAELKQGMAMMNKNKVIGERMRNLASTLVNASQASPTRITIPLADKLRALQGPMGASAGNEQQQP